MFARTLYKKSSSSLSTQKSMRDDKLRAGSRMVGLDRGFSGPRVNGQKQSEEIIAACGGGCAQSRNS
jgi:hypothetical protein